MTPRHIVSILIFLFSVICYATAQSTLQVPSEFGTVTIDCNADKNAKIYFSRANKERIELINYDFDLSFGAVKKIGQITFPLLMKDGKEIHLFEAPMGGNACDGTYYFVLIIDATQEWASSEAFGGCGGIETAQIISGANGYKLALKSPSTTRSQGVTYTLKMGSVVKTNTPMLPKKLVSKKVINKTGKLRWGTHAEGYGFIIDSSQDSTAVTSGGKFDLKNHIEEIVIAKLEVKEWDDKSRDITCLSIKAFEPPKPNTKQLSIELVKAANKAVMVKAHYDKIKYELQYRTVSTQMKAKMKELENYTTKVYAPAMQKFGKLAGEYADVAGGVALRDLGIKHGFVPALIH